MEMNQEEMKIWQALVVSLHIKFILLLTKNKTVSLINEDLAGYFLAQNQFLEHLINVNYAFDVTIVVDNTETYMLKTI